VIVARVMSEESIGGVQHIAWCRSEDTVVTAHVCNCDYIIYSHVCQEVLKVCLHSI